MTQKYSLALSISVCFPSSLPPCPSLSQMEHCMWPIYSPTTSSGHYGTQAHTHTHVTQCSRHTTYRQQLSNWLSAAYYGLEWQIGYRVCPWTRKAFIQSPIWSTFLSTADKPAMQISLNIYIYTVLPILSLHTQGFEHSAFLSLYWVWVRLSRVSSWDPFPFLMGILQCSACDLVSPALLWPGWFSDAISSVCPEAGWADDGPGTFPTKPDSDKAINRFPYEAGIL